MRDTRIATIAHVKAKDNAAVEDFTLLTTAAYRGCGLI